jgi:phosphohistidine swiveling domain-containing protein
MDIQKFEIRLLTGSNILIPRLKYKILDSIEDFDENCECIIVKTLDPDYYLLFGSVKLIISEKGSSLSHLAIVGREHNMPIFLIEEIISKIPKEGVLSIKDKSIEIETN